MEKRKTRSTAKVLRHHIMVVRLTDGSVSFSSVMLIAGGCSFRPGRG